MEHTKKVEKIMESRKNQQKKLREIGKKYRNFFRKIEEEKFGKN